MLHSLFLGIFPGCPAHIGASARSTGQCLGIVLILSLIFSFTCQQYVLPFCCLAGADCLLARGNTKLAKFTHSRASRGYFSTLYIVFIHTVEKISMAQPPFGKSTDVRRSTKAVTSWCAILLHIIHFYPPLHIILFLVLVTSTIRLASWRSSGWPTPLRTRHKSDNRGWCLKWCSGNWW